MIILRKDLIGPRENKLFLNPVDIIKDFARDYVTAAKIAQLFRLFHLYQFPCPMNSSCKRSICNPEGKESTQTALALIHPKFRFSDLANLPGLVLLPSRPEKQGKERWQRLILCKCNMTLKKSNILTESWCKNNCVPLTTSILAQDDNFS